MQKKKTDKKTKYRVFQNDMPKLRERVRDVKTNKKYKINFFQFRAIISRKSHLKFFQIEIFLLWKQFFNWMMWSYFLSYVPQIWRVEKVLTSSLMICYKTYDMFTRSERKIVENPILRVKSCLSLPKLWDFAKILYGSLCFSHRNLRIQ